MKTIFETFKKSVYNPVFYQSVAGASFSDAIRYYVKFSLFLSVVMTVVLGAILAPLGVTFIKDRAPDLVKTYYAKDLVVHIEKGTATANVAMPYFVSLTSVVGTATTTRMQNMIVIDTTKDFDMKKFEEYKTYALISNTSIATMNDNGQITIQSLRAFPVMTVSQEVLLGWVKNIQNYLGYIIAGGIIVTFIAVMFGFLMYLVPLLLFAFVPKIIAYIKSAQLSYVSAYKMSLYAIIPALALKTMFNIFGIFFLPAYFTLLVFMLIIAVNMRDTEEATLFDK